MTFHLGWKDGTFHLGWRQVDLIVTVVLAGYTIVGRPTDLADIVGEVSAANFVGAPTYLSQISASTSAIELVGCIVNITLVGDVPSAPVLTLTGRPTGDVTITAKGVLPTLIGKPVAIMVLCGDPNDVVLG